MSQKEERKIPGHVGIIMDGNRRWAQERNLPSLEGHLKGYEKVRKVADWAFSKGIKILSVYGFSTENWNRSQEEVNYLMKLIKMALEEEVINAQEKGYKVMVTGKISDLPGDMPEACYNIMEKTQGGTKGILNICLNYGGRAEIVDAIRKMIKNGLSAEQVHEGAVRKYLYNEFPDPDVIVRTSGEQRLSGFLLWQSAYSEFIFLQKYWPEFEERDVEYIIEEYNKRQRRFGI